MLHLILHCVDLCVNVTKLRQDTREYKDRQLWGCQNFIFKLRHKVFLSYFYAKAFFKPIYLLFYKNVNRKQER